MGFGKSGPDAFKTKAQHFSVGVGIVIDLLEPMPRVFDERAMGSPAGSGFLLTGRIVAVLGTSAETTSLAVDNVITVRVRPGDTTTAIFTDIERTRESTRFLLEGVRSLGDGFVARWVHGAGANRLIEELEIVGAPYVTFENPDPKIGPSSGYLRLNLDGSPTSFDERNSNGSFVTHEVAFDQVVALLKLAVESGRKFKITQRVMVPSASALVASQSELEAALVAFRKANFTSCVVRCFVKGTLDSSKVDVQVVSWPNDVSPQGEFKGIVYAMPALEETRRFTQLRDGSEEASMEVIPGYMLSLTGNKDNAKSTKHKFALDVIRGLSDRQKAMYGAQAYGPGISISVVAEDGSVNGMTRLALRTAGAQYRNLMMVPSPHFANADRIAVGKAGSNTSGHDGALAVSTIQRRAG